MGDRFGNWSEDYLHRVALAIVLEARRDSCDGILSSTGSRLVLDGQTVRLRLTQGR
ncbi:MAG: hypothetical protein J07HQX50_01520 [Haloquadratum sp. J07HQX50]|nr:MAG: hypothetical protein J07HQX50_01520 [Haloquadratum sp. J07HQX50]